MIPLLFDPGLVELVGQSVLEQKPFVLLRLWVVAALFSDDEKAILPMEGHQISRCHSS